MEFNFESHDGNTPIAPIDQLASVNKHDADFQGTVDSVFSDEEGKQV